MTKHSSPPRYSVLWSFKFLSISLIGALSMALVAIFAPLPAQIAVLGTLLSIFAGLLVASMEQEERRGRRRSALLEKLQVPIALAPEHELFDFYQLFSESLAALADQRDSVLRHFALVKLASIAEQLKTLSGGKIVFSSTETWRTVYEQLLQSAELKTYLSAAWVKTKDYWQDQPGRSSTLLNFELAARGLLIERIVILRDPLWPVDDSLPADSIRPWLEQQHERGILLSVVRESELVNESDLLCDFGIYDERATGTQELDEQSRTLRFVLAFDRASIQLAQERWKRLALYARSYRDLLDQFSGSVDPDQNGSS